MIVVVGVSHHTASIQLRERVAVPSEELEPLLRALVEAPHVTEALAVSTCNRLELVATGPGLAEALMHDVAASAAVAGALKDALILRSPHIEPHLYVHAGIQAVGHLFRVASSLDSLVVGEPQILGQVRSAFAFAREVGTVGPTLSRVLNGAVRTAKRVRTETRIGAGQISIPSVALDLAEQVFGSLDGVLALLVGSGDIAESVARLAALSGARLTVLGRNEARVSEIARAVGGQARPWSELASGVAEADLVISSTGAPGIVISERMIVDARRLRRGKSQLLIDLALPRDIAPEVDGLDGVFLYNVDDLAAVVAKTVAHRKQDAELAERIVREESERFGRRKEAEQATPTIVALRTQLESVLKAELARSLETRLKHLADDDRRALERMLEAALNKMLHAPSARLRRAAEGGSADASDLQRLTRSLHDLFALEEGASGDRARSPALGAPSVPADTHEVEGESVEPPSVRRTRGGGS